MIFQQIYVDVQLDCSNFADLCQNTQQQSLSKKTMALMVDSLLTVERSGIIYMYMPEGCTLFIHVVETIPVNTNIHSKEHIQIHSFIG